jgi:DNA-binding SARP family transcriptional activator
MQRPQHSAVLAYLLLNANLVVSTDQLVEALWGGPPPVTARTRIHACVSQIRRSLRGAGADDGLLISRPGGYRLVVGDSELDVVEFTELVARARTAVSAGQPTAAAVLLGEAVALWRGTALTGAAGAFVGAAAAALQEQRLTAIEELSEAELALGRHAELVAKLRPLADAHPLRERLVGQLMLALAGSGQQAEALRVYAVVRSRLAGQLGVDPGPGLAAAHARVLRQQVAATSGVTEVDDVPMRPTIPAQLPTAPNRYVSSTPSCSARVSTRRPPSRYR